MINSVIVTNKLPKSLHFIHTQCHTMHCKCRHCKIGIYFVDLTVCTTSHILNYAFDEITVSTVESEYDLP